MGDRYDIYGSTNAATWREATRREGDSLQLQIKDLELRVDELEREILSAAKMNAELSKLLTKATLENMRLKKKLAKYLIDEAQINLDL